MHRAHYHQYYAPSYSARRSIALTIVLAATQFGGPANANSDQVVPVASGGPYDLVYSAENAPTAAEATVFPTEWTHAGANAARNAAFDPPSGAPGWMREGVAWQYAEARAWPLGNPDSFDTLVYGARRALPTITQFYGNSMGVSAVGGMIYAESDDQFAYAINARTGQLVWRYSPVGNTLMGNPLVIGDAVYLSAGNVGFDFSEVQKFKEGKPAVRGSGVSFNGVYALDRRTGKLLWHFGTEGDAMPTPAYGEGMLFEPTGDGKVFALDARTGKQIWVNEVGGIANMSSPVYAKGRVYFGMSVKAFIYCLNAGDGKIIWKGTIPKAENTGLGDVPPALDDGILVMDSVTDTRKEGDKTTMDTTVQAFDAATGKVLWAHKMGRGPKPPAFKGGVPMIHNGIVYVGTPVNSVYQALDLKSGKLRWTWQVPDPGPAGAARGAPTWYQGVLYIATGPNLYALDAESGKLLGQNHVGGRFGIVSPTIVGGTMYLGNSWDWVIAVPLNKVNPQYRP